jgi:CDP-diacylglycerol--glycerol-3-phosphate 3-phosphatidyltransferase
MNFYNRDIYNLPNLVSFIRVLLAPVLLVLAINQQSVWFVLVVVFSEFTDVLDGYLARRLNQITALGSHLDSWGDFLIYSVLAISAWLMWPDIVRREAVYFLLIVISFTLPVLVGLVKFGTLTSYHTWGVKLAVAITVIAYLLLFMQWLDWPFRFAAIFCLLAAVEQIAITLVMTQQHEDVRTIWQALQFKRSQKNQDSE